MQFFNQTPVQDSDKDGVPNWWELQNQLNPNNPRDVLRLFQRTNYTGREAYADALANSLLRAGRRVGLDYERESFVLTAVNARIIGNPSQLPANAPRKVVQNSTHEIWQAVVPAYARVDLRSVLYAASGQPSAQTLSGTQPLKWRGPLANIRYPTLYLSMFLMPPGDCTVVSLFVQQ